jgi:hypothetical protein
MAWRAAIASSARSLAQTAAVAVAANEWAAGALCSAPARGLYVAARRGRASGRVRVGARPIGGFGVRGSMASETRRPGAKRQIGVDLIWWTKLEPSRSCMCLLGLGYC